MTSTYTANNGIEKIETGDQSGTWGETTNTNFDIIDRALNGVGSITLSGTSHTLTTTDGSLTDGMFKVLSLAGSPTGTNTITISPNDQDKLYFVKNASGQSAVFSQGTGANVTIPDGGADIIFADGAGSGAAVSSLFASSVTFGSDVLVGDDLTLNSDDAVLGFGADTDIKIIHDPDDGLFFKSTATGDDNPFVLTIQTGETDIAADDKLGVINFQAPDEGTGTDAILVAAGIEAVSEGDFSASSNATSLVFKTGASEAAAEKVRIQSDGDVLIGSTANVYPEKLLVFQGTSEDKEGITVYAGNTSYTQTLVRAQSATASTGGNYRYFDGLSTGGAVNFFVASDGSAFFNGSIGAGTSSPSSTVDIDCRRTGVLQAVSTDTVQLLASNGGSTLKNVSNNPLLFGTNNTERMRLTAAGNLGIGATAPAARLSLGALVDNKVFGLYDDGTNFYGLGIGSANYKFQKPSAAVFTFNNLDRANDTTTEIARFDTSGRFMTRKTSTGLEKPGVETHTADNGFLGTTSTGATLHCNREDSDGTLVTFRHDNTAEGSIIISGTTVTYNGGHLGRWSQASDGNRIDGLLKGTVMTNLDKMAVWTKEDGTIKDNEQLNCMAVSSVEGDANVAGVFINWNEDKEEELNDPYGKSCVNDMNVAMTGDMVIRIASGTTIARGDLLMSAGDGTAKPQGDDIVRSKTVAKVTSTHISHTYDDGSFLVPVVLMAC